MATHSNILACERFPEGFRSFDEPDNGYEPTYDELVADGEYKEEVTMKNLNYAQLNMELINKGIIYDAPDCPDGYNQCCCLEGVYDWGFTVVTYCDVLDPIITFYDWECQAILSLDMDDNTTYSLRNGRLYAKVSYMFSDRVEKIHVYLNDGAPVHQRDITAIGYMANLTADDRRFYALNDGRIYFKADGETLRVLQNVTIEDLTRQGFTIIDPENYGANIDVLNDMICKL